MKKFTYGLKIPVFCLSCLLLWSFTSIESVEEGIGLIHSIISKHYDKDVENTQLKRYELNFTNNGFCRYRKFYNNGKIEYFAFNVSRFKELDYYGTTDNGQLWLRTIDEDVIVQTYNDKKGDIDTMSRYLVIPLKAIEAEELNLISKKLTAVRNSLK